MENIGEPIINGINTLIKKQLKYSNFDKTFVGIIKNDNNNNTYDVEYLENEYTNIKVLNAISLSVGDTVLCLKIQNNDNNLIILGRI